MDVFSSEKRSSIMKKIKSKNTKLEKILIDELIQNNLNNFITHVSELPGVPDIVFPENKIILFMDSCFWHGCPEHLRMPKTNQNYWENKIRKNIERDKKYNIKLKNMGWKVIRIWEHSLKNKEERNKTIIDLINKLKT